MKTFDKWWATVVEKRHTTFHYAAAFEAWEAAREDTVPLPNREALVKWLCDECYDSYEEAADALLAWLKEGAR